MREGCLGKGQVGMLGTGFMGDDKGKRGWHLGDEGEEWRESEKNPCTPGAIWHIVSSGKKEKSQKAHRISLFWSQGPIVALRMSDARSGY